MVTISLDPPAKERNYPEFNDAFVNSKFLKSIPTASAFVYPISKNILFPLKEISLIFISSINSYSDIIPLRVNSLELDYNYDFSLNSTDLIVNFFVENEIPVAVDGIPTK